MEIIFILIAVSALMGAFFLVSFIWTVRTGQYEDMATPAYRILFDETEANRQLRQQNQPKQHTIDRNRLTTAADSIN